MTFEGGFLIAFAFVFGVPLLLLLAQFVGWLTGTNAKPIRWVLLSVILLPIAASIYLDTVAPIRTVAVVDKNEIVKLNENDSGRYGKGLWSRTRSVQVEYQPPGEANRPMMLWLASDAETFDALTVGQTIEVRLVDFGEIFKVARMTNRSTLSFVAELMPRQPRGEWRQTAAVVRDVRHITEYRVGRSTSGLRQLHAPYDVVELSFIPEGRAEAVSAVDVIERGSVPELVQGNYVQITWAADDPRAARIVGARPGAPWANWFYVLTNELLIAGTVIGVALLGLMLLARRRGRNKPVQV